MPKRTWSPEQVSTLIAGLGAGKSRDEIAADVGMTALQVRHKVIDLQRKKPFTDSIVEREITHDDLVFANRRLIALMRRHHPDRETRFR